jgi:3-oxoacyl-[acyl-carrier-protein] synthase-3
MMLDQPAIKKVVLVNADTLSRTCGPRDRSARPLIGDAASIAVLERSEESDPIHADLRMDGSRHAAIMIPAGGFRAPKTAETAVEEMEADSNYRSPEHYHMDGLAVLNFVQKEISAQVEELLSTAETSKDEVDWYMFHQPNRFMVDKLADRLGIPRGKVPSDIVAHYGNASSVTIPTAIVHTLGDAPTRQSYRMCLCGFGVGLTWCGMLLRVGPLTFCKMIDF